MNNNDIVEKNNPQPLTIKQDIPIMEPPISNSPNYVSLQSNVVEASKLVDDIILKKYLHKLTALEIVPLDEDLKKLVIFACSKLLKWFIRKMNILLTNLHQFLVLFKI